ncbi:hypothetical protein FPV67DRAFT_1467753 [Lyophyllum atratum]|nr:hypothetical protein FPV67DRAFT_1467753 [Lyophyllum atratum]
MARMSFSQSLRCIASLLFLLGILTISLLLSINILGYSVRLRGIAIRPFSISLYGLSYSHTTTLSISSSHLYVALHLPRSFKVTFMTATLYDYEYADPLHHVSLSKLHLEFSFLPAVPDTFIAAVLDDFRVRVFDSEHTPPWMKALREDLVSTVINGKHTRADHLKTKITFSSGSVQKKTVTIADDKLVQEVDHEDDAPGSCADKDPECPPHVDDDEAILTLTASDWHIGGLRNRLYQFGTVDAQLRHSWEPQSHRGSFVLIATDSCWLLAPGPPAASESNSRADVPAQVETTWPIYCLRILTWPLQVLRRLVVSPIPTVIRTIRVPSSVLNFHIPRLDVTFDRFRLRDAELVHQSAEFLARQYVRLETKEDMDVGGFVQDMFWAGIVAGVNKGRKTRGGD